MKSVRARNAGRAASLARAGLLAIACLAALASPAAGAQRIVVVKAAENERLGRTVAAMKADARGVAVDVVSLPVPAEARAEPLPAGPGDVLVALGPRSSQYLATMTPRPPSPVVHCLAGPDARGTLIPSEPPMDVQIAWLGRLLPTARRIALLYDPAVNTRRAESTAAALQAANYEVVTEAVRSPAALPQALARVTGRVDALFALPDRMVFTNETSRGLILFSFRNRIPIVGPNDAWVRLGALYAVDWDYAEVGTLCIDVAARELGVARNGPPPPPRPRVSVNLRSAEQFKLNWDAAVLARVDRRHE